MDITNEESVKKGLKEVSKAVSSLRAVVNVSGVMFMGSLIEEGEGRLNQIMQVNLMGIERVNRLFFPLVEKEKGRFINFSSEYGTYQVVPFNAFYITNNHAVESYSDGLRRELKYNGIPVITIRPGAVKIEMENSTSSIFIAINDKSTHYKVVLK